MTGEPRDDAALSEDVESAFDVSKFVELEIRVRLPAELSPNGLPLKFGIKRILSPDDVQLGNTMVVVPHEIARVMRLLEMSMRFRA